MTVRTGLLKAVPALMVVCLGAYILGPPLYWHLTEAFGSSGCPPCDCDCDSMPNLLSIHHGVDNDSITDCAKHSDEDGDAQKKFAELLSEELKQRRAEAFGKQQRTNMVLLEAKKMTSQYQKDADKCNSGMETCEETREKSETKLFAQMQLTALWEQRAHQKGWNKGKATSQAKNA